MCLQNRLARQTRKAEKLPLNGDHVLPKDSSQTYNKPEVADYVWMNINKTVSCN
jgi:hypothetical protein